MRNSWARQHIWGLSAALLLTLLAGCKSGSDQAATGPLKISGTPPTAVSLGQQYRFVPSVTTAAADPYSFAISNKPHWAVLNAATGELSGMPTAADVGVYANIVVTVSNKAESASLAPFTVQVTASGTSPGSGPTISGTPANSVGVGKTYSFIPVAAEANGNALGFSVQNKPAWMSFDAATGELSGTPTTGDTGTYSNILITVTDGNLSASLPVFSVTVTAANAAGGTASLTWAVPTTNTDGTPLTNLAGFRIYYGYSSSAMTNLITIANTGTTNYVVQNLGTGVWYFTVKAYNSANVESDQSPIVHKSI